MPRRFVWHPGKGPTRTEKPIPAEVTKVEIRQVRSEIGHSQRMRQTLDAIGLRHHQDVIVRAYSPSLAGQLRRVRHLVKVTAADGAKATAAAAKRPPRK
jgi:large subunit ribosomal protein L30